MLILSEVREEMRNLLLSQTGIILDLLKSSEKGILQSQTDLPMIPLLEAERVQLTQYIDEQLQKVKSFLEIFQDEATMRHYLEDRQNETTTKFLDYMITPINLDTLLPQAQSQYSQEVAEMQKLTPQEQTIRQWLLQNPMLISHPSIKQVLLDYLNDALSPDEFPQMSEDLGFNPHSVKTFMIAFQANDVIQNYRLQLLLQDDVLCHHENPIVMHVIEAARLLMEANAAQNPEMARAAPNVVNPAEIDHLQELRNGFSALLQADVLFFNVARRAPAAAEHVEIEDNSFQNH